MMLPTGRCVLAQARLIGGRAVSISRAYTRSRLLSTLAVLEQKDGQLSHGSLSAFTAAKKLGGTVHGFIAGNNISAAAQEAAKVEGVEKILVVDSAAYDKVCDHSPQTPFPPKHGDCFSFL
jgi:electron transfer flavoprotein alpha subunit